MPGSIQPHGVLLVLGDEDFVVLQASENVADLLGRSAGEILGRPLGEVIGVDAAERLDADLANAPVRSRPVFLRTVTVERQGSDRSFHAVGHRTDGGVVLELEAAPAGDAADVRALLAELSAERTC